MSLDSQVAIAPLQHGYHRLTGFSGRLGSPTNPVRWSDSSSFATLKGTQGRYGIYFSVSYDMKTILLIGSLRSPPIRLRRTFSTGKRVTRFSGRFAPLRIVFPCHPIWGKKRPPPPPRQRPQPLARALAQGHMPLCRAAAGPFGNTDQPTSPLNWFY